MHVLIDRATGAVLAETTPENFTVLQNNLTRESDTDYDFYLNDATLSYLVECGLSSDLSDTLQSQLGVRGVDMGWENPRNTDETLYFGRVVDQYGSPLGGVRIDLLERVAVDTNKPDGTLDVIDWTYTRTDGSFFLGLDQGLPGSVWRASGRGDLELHRADIETLGDLGSLTIPVLHGSVAYENGDTPEGISVQLLGWTCLTSHDRVAKADIKEGLTWGDSRTDGTFIIPVNFPESVDGISVQLELLALYGETLLETEVELSLSSSYDIGPLVVTPLESGQELATEIEPEETTTSV